MRINFLCLTFFVLTVAGPAFADGCATYSDNELLMQYLLDNKAHSLEADSGCVGRAFAQLSHEKGYIERLVSLLDFERSTENDDHLRTRASRYPAIAALGRSDAVPYLLKAIKENNSELVRINALYALGLAYDSCSQSAAAVLRTKAAQSTNSAEERARLRRAARWMEKSYEWRRPCSVD